MQKTQGRKQRPPIQGEGVREQDSHHGGHDPGHEREGQHSQEVRRAAQAEVQQSGAGLGLCQQEATPSGEGALPREDEGGDGAHQRLPEEGEWGKSEVSALLLKFTLA